MTQASISGLIEFIRAQPADRPIDHASWHSCAVGDYAREVLNTEVYEYTFDRGEYDLLRADPVIRELYRQAGSMFNWVHQDFGAPKKMDYTIMDRLALMRHGEATTYGALVTMLQAAEKSTDQSLEN